jgi:MFS transporter, DHA2 family, multidrug resistance protein
MPPNVAIVIAPGPAEPARSPARGDQWIVTLAVLGGALMATVDAIGPVAAVRYIQGTYGVTIIDARAAFSLYPLGMALTGALSPWLTAVLGRKGAFLWSIALFTVASAFCGLASTIEHLIAFRLIQGLSAGPLLATAQAIISDEFPPGEQGLAMGMFGMIPVFGPAIAPVLAAWLTYNYGWQWLFFINLPIGPFALFIVSRFVRNDQGHEAQRASRQFDVLGAGLLVIGLAALYTTLLRGALHGWLESPFIVLTTALAVLALVAFVLWELHTPTPLVDVRIFKNFAFASATVIAGIMQFAFSGFLILDLVVLQAVLNYPITVAGLVAVPRALVMAMVMPVAGALYDRFGVHPLSFGLILIGLAGWSMTSFTLDTGPLQFLTADVIQGVGFGLMFAPVTAAALATIPRPLMVRAVGLHNFVRLLGASLGLMSVLIYAAHKTAAASAWLVHYANPYSPVFQQWMEIYQNGFLARGADLLTAQQQALAVVQGLIYRQATVVAYAYDFGLFGLPCVACLPLLVLVRRRAIEAGHRPQTRTRRTPSWAPHR